MNNRDEQLIGHITKIEDSDLHEAFLLLRGMLKAHEGLPAHAGIDVRVKNLEDEMHSFEALEARRDERRMMFNQAVGFVDSLWGRVLTFAAGAGAIAMLDRLGIHLGSLFGGGG